MSDEITESRKQLTTYADAITAFATAQLVGFVFLMAHGDCFTRNILGGLRYTVGVGAFVNLCYVFLVFLCHQGADKIRKDSPAVAPVMRGVRLLRYLILFADLIVTVSLPFGINHGLHGDKPTFFLDCKAPENTTTPTTPPNPH
jgi:hypothetical protein